MDEDEEKNVRKIYEKLLSKSREVSKKSAQSRDITEVQQKLGYNRLAVRNILSSEDRKGYHLPSEGFVEGEVDIMIAEINAHKKRFLHNTE